MVNLKEKALGYINETDGEVIGIIQILVNEQGKVITCAGGYPDVLTKVLAQIMKENQRIKEIFESAWCEANNPEI